MLTNVTDVVLPPLNLAGESINFFCSVKDESWAAHKLLASLKAWDRMDSLTSADIARLISAGVRSEDAWYELAGRWMHEALESLDSPAACKRALKEVEPVLQKMKFSHGELSRYLKQHCTEVSYGYTAPSHRIH